MRQLQKTIGANFSVGLIGRLLSQTITFLVVIYLARVLGPVNYGELSLVMAAVSYFNLLATFGLPTVGTREIARVQANSQDTVNQLLSLRLSLAVIAYFFMILYGVFFIENYKLFCLLLLYGLTMLSSACLLDWFFVGMEDLQSVALANVIGNIFGCALTFLFVNTAADIYYIPAIAFLGAFITSIYLLYLYRKIQPLHLRINLDRFYNLLRTALPFAAAGTLSQIYGNMDMILLGYFVGSEEVGYYSVAYKIVFVLSGIIAIYSQSTWPVMIRIFATDKKQVNSFLQTNLHSMLYFMIPVASGGTILGHQMITVFFGEVYAPAVIPFILLLYYVFLMAISITLANLLLTINKDKAYFGTLVLGSLVNIAANLLLIPYWRAIGAAGAMVISEFAVLIFLASKIHKLLKTQWIEKKFILIILGCNTIMSLCIYILQQWTQVHVAVSIVIGSIIYLGVSWPFCAKFIRRAKCNE